MAKAETGLRTRIKKALEADGWSVVVQHGSAYSPYIPDLLVVLAALEVKTETGVLEPGQRNRIRRFRREGIPAGVVRSIEEARQGMQLVRQGAYRVIDNPQAPVVDMSFLQGILAQAAPATPEPQPEPAPAAEPPVQLTELLGMQGQFETFEPQPAPEEPEIPATPSLESLAAMAEMHEQLDDGPKVQVPATDTVTFPTIANLEPHTQAPALPPQMGVMEQILHHVRHTDEMVSAIVAALGGGATTGFQMPAAAAPQDGQTVRRKRRTRAEIEADAAAARGESTPVE